jgi:Family of unknown function (DUF6279)
VRQRIARLVLAAAALLLAACSTTHLMYSSVTLAYTNAAPMLAWYVGDYVEMTGEQKDWVRDRLDRMMSWHRARELPEYRRFLEAVAASAEHGFTVEEVRAAHREYYRHYHRLLDQVIPEIADFLLQLDPGQIEQLERKFAADNGKFDKESIALAAEERRSRGMRRMVEHLEEWVGKLDGAQRKLVAARLAAMPDSSADRLAHRRYRQSETMALVRAKVERERMIAGLRRLLIDTESWRSPEALQRQRERDSRWFEMVSALSSTLSAVQREHLQQRLRGYVRELTQLSASP